MASLWVIRHAKSSWANSGERDEDRTLNARGEKNGKQMGQWFSSQKAINWLLVSNAKRAQATANLVTGGLQVDEVFIDNRLYLANLSMLFEVLNEIPDDVLSAAIVGHNPGLTYLVNALSNDVITDNLPTLGCAHFHFDCSWHQLQSGMASLQTFITPKTLP